MPRGQRRWPDGIRSTAVVVVFCVVAAGFWFWLCLAPTGGTPPAMPIDGSGHAHGPAPLADTAVAGAASQPAARDDVTVGHGEAPPASLPDRDIGTMLTAAWLPMRLTGRVVAQSGDPIAGASVGAWSASERAETRTAADGSFALEIRWAPAEQSDAFLMVEAWHEDYQARREQLSCLSGSGTALACVIKLPPGQSITGRVLYNGSPVSGAVVEAMNQVGKRPFWTDVHGHFAIGWPADEERVTRLRAWHGQYGAAEVHLDPHRAPATIGDVALNPCGTLAFRLLLPDGQPLAGIPVDVTALEGAARAGFGAQYCRILTGAGGEATLYGMLPGRHSVSLPTFLPSSRRSSVASLVADGTTHSIVVDCRVVHLACVHKQRPVGRAFVSTRWRQLVGGAAVGETAQEHVTDIFLIERGAMWEVVAEDKMGWTRGATQIGDELDTRAVVIVELIDKSR